jgi:hypothetical protein
MAPIEFLFFEVNQALFHLAFGLAVAVLLTEFFFFHFNKVPFTCSYLPAKSHLAFLAGAYLYGFSVYTFTIAGLERWVGRSPARITVFFCIVIAVLVGIASYRRRSVDLRTAIIYEDDTDPLVRQLNLT